MNTLALITVIAIWGVMLFMVRHIRRARLRENAEAYLYLLPAGVVLTVFWFFPVLFSILVSFTNWTGASRLSTVDWTGLTNYTRALKDPDFHQVLYNTVNYVVYSVPLTLACALMVAMTMNTK